MKRLRRHPAEPNAAPEKVAFSFEGRAVEGLAGEPLALALFRAGVRTLSYSIKYHYPRGVRCGRGRCRQCDVEVNGIPGVPACVTPLEAGMDIRREDHGPFYARFFSIILRKLSLPAGFYYRLFTKPNFINRLFVSALRRMTGVGRLDPSGDSPTVPADVPPAALIHSIRDSYDVVVTGGGPAGLAASLAASGGGRRVLLIEETGRLGGFDLRHPADQEAAAERHRLIRETGDAESITVARGLTAQGFYPPGTLLLQAPPDTLAGAGSVKRIQARSIIFATGAYDRLPLFRNNHLPGIFGPRAVRLLLERDGYPLGDTAVVYGAGALLGDTAAFLEASGIRTVSVVDTSTGVRLKAAQGRRWVEKAVFESAEPGGTFSHPCDVLCIALPGQGTYELPQQAGFQFKFGDAGPGGDKLLLPAATRLQIDGGAACFLAGEITGEMDRRRIIEQGRLAGEAAASFVSGSGAQGGPANGGPVGGGGAHNGSPNGGPPSGGLDGEDD